MYDMCNFWAKVTVCMVLCVGLHLSQLIVGLTHSRMSWTLTIISNI